MRTTINIDSELLAQAKRSAASKQTTLGQLIEDALRAMLLKSPERQAAHVFNLVTFQGDGPCDDVDLDRTSQLLTDDDASRYRPGG